MREPINLKDRNGKEIREGDLVRFVVSYDYQDPPQPSYDTKDGTEMIDTVVVDGGTAFFMCPITGCGAFAWTHNQHCEVIGSIYDKKPELAL